MVLREIQSDLLSHFFKGKVIVLLGARRTGKTTLFKQLLETQGEPYLWLNADEPDVRTLLQNKSSVQIKSLFGNNQIVAIDEAQRLENAGLILKLIVDSFPEIQLLATGSSAFELSDKIKEPLTGRKFEYHLYPFSTNELMQHSDFLHEQRQITHRLVYGYYPEVVNSDAGDERYILNQISSDYLYKDLFMLRDIRKPDILQKLVEALAWQVGSEVSYNEFSQMVSADIETVERYICMLEEAYIVFRLGSFSRNLRNEIKRSRKIYFNDNGIRNAVIGNLTPFDVRNDKGALWENYLVSERRKRNAYNKNWTRTYFWRTHAQQEIDYIEEVDGQIFAWEFTLNPKRKKRFSRSFLNAYPNVNTQVIHRDNYQDFVNGERT